jgi:hypothetical protein
MGRILQDSLGGINMNFVLASEIIKVSAPSGDEEKNINRRARRDRRANKLEYWNDGISKPLEYWALFEKYVIRRLAGKNEKS